jgi:capsule polysaccharide export protein KpsC/LpsZ
MLYRDKDYYELLCSIPKLVLVPLDADYQELMRSSAFCATITGSVGWESMLAGKPAMVFGYSWYSACPACFRVTSIDECRRAISAMKQMSKEDVHRALMRYLIYYSRFFVKFAGNPRHVREFDCSYEEQIKAYATAVTAPSAVIDT